MMKRAAETATRVGDVERAIGSFLDAALIAPMQAAPIRSGR